jgi:hypothetical protein
LYVKIIYWSINHVSLVHEKWKWRHDPQSHISSFLIGSCMMYEANTFWSLNYSQAGLNTQPRLVFGLICSPILPNAPLFSLVHENTENILHFLNLKLVKICKNNKIIKNIVLYCNIWDYYPKNIYYWPHKNIFIDNIFQNQ